MCSTQIVMMEKCMIYTVQLTSNISNRNTYNNNDRLEYSIGLTIMNDCGLDM